MGASLSSPKTGLRRESLLTVGLPKKVRKSSTAEMQEVAELKPNQKSGQETEKQRKDNFNKWFKHAKKLVRANKEAFSQHNVLKVRFKFIMKEAQIHVDPDEEEERILSVDLEEFKLMCLVIWPHLSQVLNFDEILKSLFEAIDCDQNKRVDQNEFSIVMSYLMNYQYDESHTKQIFSRIYEKKISMKSEPEKFNEHFSFNTFDGNKDYGLSALEFGTLLKTLLGPTKDNFLRWYEMGPIGEGLKEYLRKTEFAQHLEYVELIYPYLNSKVAIPREVELGLKELLRLVLPASKLIDKKTVERHGEEINLFKYSDFDMDTSALMSKIEDELVNFKKNLTFLEDNYDNMATKNPVVFQVWKSNDLALAQNLNYNGFKKFMKSVPGIFQYIEGIESKFSEYIDNIKRGVLVEVLEGFVFRKNSRAGDFDI